jgi:hypothetical protein
LIKNARAMPRPVYHQLHGLNDGNARPQLKGVHGKVQAIVFSPHPTPVLIPALRLPLPTTELVLPQPHVPHAYAGTVAAAAARIPAPAMINFLNT